MLYFQNAGTIARISTPRRLMLIVTQGAPLANEEKSHRFERLAERRVAEAIKKLRLIGNLSNRSNYDYSAEHVKQMFLAMERELKAAKDRFALNSANTPSFSFQKKKQDSN